MGTITGYTAEFIDAVLNGTIAGASVIGGNLIFTRTGGGTFNAGSVVGPQGNTGPPGPTSIQIVTSATRPGSPAEGQFIYETDTDRFWSWNGTVWIERGIGFVICTSATRPTADLYNGVHIYETDTKRHYFHDGTGWVYQGGAAPAIIAPSLQNSWVNFGAPWLPAGYTKDGSGFVHLEGVIKNGTATAGTQLFPLPAGYRPPGDITVSAKMIEGTTQSIGSLTIIGTAGGSLGQVQIASTSGITNFNDAIFLDGISFRATQ